MVSEDFSFPKITNPLPHFAVTPSLWRVSSVIYPDGDYYDDDDEMEFLKNTEEKMDMLWEDFNEELERVSSLGQNKQLSSKSNNCKTGPGDHQLCCVQALKLSKRCTTLYHPKKQSLVLVLKVLKKIFLLHKSTQIKKNN